MTDEISETETSKDPVPLEGGILSTVITASNPIIGFLMEYWKEIFLIVFLLFLGYQHYRIDYLENEVSAKSAEIVVYKNNAAVSDAKVTQMGQQITDLSVKSADLNKELANLKPILDNIKKNTDVTVTNIMKGPTPKTCADINSYILKNQTNFTWSK